MQDSSLLLDDWEIGYVPEGCARCFETRTDSTAIFKYEAEGNKLLKISISAEIGNQYLDNEHYIVRQLSLRDRRYSP